MSFLNHPNRLAVTKSVSRRELLRAGLTGAVAAAATGLAWPRDARAVDVPASPTSRPNILLIVCDQLGFDAMSWAGCTDVSTPNLDRLRSRSVAFNRTHSPDPVCSPARGALFTGRMPVETGVIANAREVRADLPNMGQWLSQQGGYETVYCGKWHLSEGWAREGGVPGFTVLPTGDGQGALVDHTITLSCEAYLDHRKAPADKPFLLVASYMQPHDICLWGILQEQLVPTELPFPQLRNLLPQLPPNHSERPLAPADLDRLQFKRFKTDEQWRFYLYNYYRLVEQLDLEVGRLLTALERTGHADDTVVLFTSDHGDGRARHGHVQKGYPYDEAVRVPLLVSWPGHLRQPELNDRDLVSLLDIVPTICDYAGIAAPSNARGRSLRPLLEGTVGVAWRDHVVSQYRQSGRVVRSDQYKYVRQIGDPVQQLFDMRNDPWETRNLYLEPSLRDVIAEHGRLLDAHEAGLSYAPNVDRATLREKVQS
jgi:arylsulfatase A-like enzyme